MPVKQLEPLILTKPINRDEQTNLFRDKINRIQSKRSVRYRLLEWYGGPGIGKTQLIRLLADECNRQEIPWTLVNFLEANKQQDSYEDDPALFLSQIVSDLAKRTNISENTRKKFKEAIGEFRRDQSLPENVVQAYFHLPRRERLYKLPDWLRQWVNVVETFITLVESLTVPKNKLGQIRPVVFFFDETEYASSLLVDWIEEWVINPLLRSPHFLVAWTARQPWRWKRPDIRQKLSSQLLPPFKEKEVQQQLEVSIQPELAQELFQSIFVLTNGHPYANDVTISQIHQWQDENQELTAQFIRDHQSVVFQEIFDKFIQNYVFAGLDPDAQTALKLTAFVRVFDSHMLRELLQKHGGSHFVAISMRETQQILERLKQTHFLVWRKGYTLLSDLCHLIRKYYLTNEPDRFIAINQTALQVNRDWLNKVSDNLNVYAVEELYHMASLREASETVNMVAQFQQRLVKYEGQQTDIETRRHVLERLEGELEKDDELGQILTHDELSIILAEVRKRLRENVPVPA